MYVLVCLKCCNSAISQANGAGFEGGGDSHARWNTSGSCKACIIRRIIEGRTIRLVVTRTTASIADIVLGGRDIWRVTSRRSNRSSSRSSLRNNSVSNDVTVPRNSAIIRELCGQKWDSFGSDRTHKHTLRYLMEPYRQFNGY